jgi:hypothetical protein
MKPPTMAPVYAQIYPIMAEAARSVGYALALHGTLSRDLDVVAIPWVDDAVDAEALVEVIRDSIGARLLSDVVPARQVSQAKPHGRRAWSLLLEAPGVVDLSVMPRTAP